MGDGGGTSFESMSHEQMLAWLDQANGGVVQAAADRLVAAATEIRKIADELKVRPQWVRWKGEGANAFRTWSGQLANTTHRLGDFSEDSAKWLARASEAIATAQASIPRDKAGAEGNLKAAQSAPNDPDARVVGAKSADELARIAEGKEKVRQEAAAEMRKLGQAYQLSAQQLEGLERPRFRPLPEAVQPGPQHFRQSEAPSSEWRGAALSPSSPAAVAAGGPSAVGLPPSSAENVAPSGGMGGGPDGPGTAQRTSVPQAPGPGGVGPVAVEPVGVEIDGTSTLPQAPSAPPANPGGPPSSGRPDGGTAQPTGVFPPTLGGPRLPVNPAMPPGPGRAMPTGGRPPTQPGPGPTGPVPGRAPAGGPPVPPNSPGPTRPVVGGTPTLPPGRAGGAPPGPSAGRDGIVGGRPAPSTPGGLPRGSAIGGPNAGTGARGPVVGRGPMGPGSGVVGGQPRQQGRAGDARGFTSGGSGLGQGRNPAGGGSASSPTGRNGMPLSTPRPSATRRDDERRDRPDYLTEDQEVWRQDGRRVVPPVID
ncbi:translation initiation factor IF-2 [Streptomyces lasiicapitis]|uniref:Translation initiation factor IF-2 n=1 Tax=Streptomyces lasiicapitis TaxID=1923961 RepID=A0ABQ2LJI3_9ACTN|nr:translation initiation factor IF-2 [Streptomyces lasiicapitis]GGO34773.1 hypothetical protein GCM10012286_04380 [Streptomyces lasiicapitis]